MRGGETYTVRRATPEDAEGITRVHVLSWRSSYRGLLSQEYLDTLDATERLAGWRHALAHPETFGIRVAVARGDIVGFVSAGPSRGSPVGFPGELYALYLLDEAKGHGLGRALFHEAHQWLRSHGLSPMALWVLKDNASARGFYEHLGGRLLGEQSITLGAVPYPEVAYGWDP